MTEPLPDQALFDSMRRARATRRLHWGDTDRDMLYYCSPCDAGTSYTRFTDTPDGPAALEFFRNDTRLPQPRPLLAARCYYAAMSLVVAVPQNCGRSGHDVDDFQSITLSLAFVPLFE